MKKLTSTETKEGFLKILSVATPTEINKIIEQKGQQIKGIPLIVKY